MCRPDPIAPQVLLNQLFNFFKKSDCSISVSQWCYSAYWIGCQMCHISFLLSFPLKLKISASIPIITSIFTTVQIYVMYCRTGVELFLRVYYLLVPCKSVRSELYLLYCLFFKQCKEKLCYQTHIAALSHYHSDPPICSWKKGKQSCPFSLSLTAGK